MAALTNGRFITHDTNAIVWDVTTKRYRYRAYPTPGQQGAAARLFGCVRVAWNDALAARETARKNGATIPSRADLSAALTKSKATPERAWMTEVSSVPLQQSLADLDRAYRNFFDSISGRRRGRKVNPPRFKKRTNAQSARFTRNAGFKVRETTHGVGHVTLPKIGRVRYASSRPLPAPPSSVTLLQESDGRYYVSFTVESADVETAPNLALPVAGVDLGLADLAIIVRTDGTREKVPNPRWLRSRQRRLARAYRSRSRRRAGAASAGGRTG